MTTHQPARKLKDDSYNDQIEEPMSLERSRLFSLRQKLKLQTELLKSYLETLKSDRETCENAQKVVKDFREYFKNT